jgi:MYXO-CTERM domain-containing protein
VLGFFAGSPYSLAHARDILAGTSISPAFDSWCGPLAQVDFSNGTTADSLGRMAPVVRCLPFQDPLAEQRYPCLAIPGLPAGRYATSGGAVLRLRGYFAVRAAGAVTFAWGHDDGMAFDVGNVAVFAYADSTAPRVDRRVVRFAAPGLYPFQLDWFDGGGNALIDWYVADGEHPADEAPDAGLAAAGFRLVPAGDLYPSGALPCTPDCRRCALPTPRCDYARSRCVACADDRDCARGTRCADGACAAPAVVDAGAPDAGAPDAGAAFAAAADAAAGAAGEGGGCACAAGRSEGARPGALGAIVALAAALRRRRRERTRGRR